MIFFLYDSDSPKGKRGRNRYCKKNGIKKKAGIFIPISDKTDFKTNLIIRDKVEYFVLIKVTIHKEDTMLLKIHS